MSVTSRLLSAMAAGLCMVALMAMAAGQAWAQTCSQLRAEEAQAATVYETCMTASYKGQGPCTQQKINYLALLAAANGACNPVAWVLTPMEPNVRQGGRVNGLAVNPGNDQNDLAASESGGLFVSNDRGLDWTHVDTLPPFQTNAVAFLPSNPSTVFLAASSDFGSPSGGGVWMSADGGLNWAQSPSPATPAGASGAISATDISIAPDTGEVWVASSYGLLASADQGAHWRLLQPFGAGDPAVVTVAALGGGHVLAAGSGGVRRSADDGGHWLTPTAGVGSVTDLHALGRSSFSNSLAFVVDGNTSLYVTSDGGDHWTAIPAAPSGGGGCGGISFVKTIAHPGARDVRGAKDRLDIYFSNECWVYKLTASRGVGAGSFDYSGTWTQLVADHSDSRDLAFDHQDNPLLLGTDGGLHGTSDFGAHWTLQGGGSHGYNALQITEVKGQVIDGINRHDLYFGTQDNDMWSSKDNGATWQDAECCEGFFIERLFHTPAVAGDEVTLVDCSGCANQLSGALFSGIAQWPDPQKAVNGNPFIISQSFHIEAVDARAPFSKGYAYTTDLGKTWGQYVSVSDDLDELPKLSWLPAATRPFFRPAVPVLYQAVKTGWYGPGNFQVTQLARIVGNASLLLIHPTPPSATISYPANSGFGGLGINPTMFAWYQVFAVDPANPNHVVAPDVVNQQIMQTTDGAATWTPMTALTAMVTDNGKLPFNLGVFPLASAVSFNPDNSACMAVGSWQNGVFMSADGGATWARVPRSELVPRVTAFDWLSCDDVVISSYGRGLWRATYQQAGPVNNLPPNTRLAALMKPAAAPTELAAAGVARSPITGVADLKLITGHPSGSHVALAGQTMSLSAVAHRPGTSLDVVLDLRAVSKVQVGDDGTAKATVNAPLKAGLHTLTLVDPATGKVISGSMFIVRPNDPRDRAP